ncbi:unnamed protein product, partial [Candidula unifasciata]
TGMSIQVGIVCQPCLMSHVKIGYVSYANGDIVSVSDVNLKLWEVAENCHEPPTSWSFSFIAGGQTFLVKASRGTVPVWYHHDDRGGKVMEVFTEFEVNSVQGRGISEYFYRNLDGPSMTFAATCPLVREPSQDEISNNLGDLTLPLTSLACRSLACRSSALVGGKGGQLAQLASLQVAAQVSPGVCLTLSSCQLQFQHSPVVIHQTVDCNAIEAVAILS